MKKMQQKKNKVLKITVFGLLIVLITLTVASEVKLKMAKENKTKKRIASNSAPTLETAANAVSSYRIKGNKNAKIILIEFSDFQCPACASFYPGIKKITEEFEDDIKMVFFHYPLRRIHPNAEEAALAAEAAGKQSKFWIMHDMIFEKQQEWSRKTNVKQIFVNYASALGLDTKKFQKDLDSQDLKNKVANDIKNGIRAGVNSTPTLFLNNKIIRPNSYNNFKALIRDKILRYKLKQRKQK